jgi:hypothetical protein
MAASHTQSIAISVAIMDEYRFEYLMIFLSEPETLKENAIDIIL